MKQFMFCSIKDINSAFGDEFSKLASDIEEKNKEIEKIDEIIEKLEISEKSESIYLKQLCLFLSEKLEESIPEETEKILESYFKSNLEKWDLDLFFNERIKKDPDLKKSLDAIKIHLECINTQKKLLKEMEKFSSEEKMSELISKYFMKTLEISTINIPKEYIKNDFIKQILNYFKFIIKLKHSLIYCSGKILNKPYPYFFKQNKFFKETEENYFEKSKKVMAKMCSKSEEKELIESSDILNLIGIDSLNKQISLDDSDNNWKKLLKLIDNIDNLSEDISKLKFKHKQLFSRPDSASKILGFSQDVRHYSFEEDIKNSEKFKRKLIKTLYEIEGFGIHDLRFEMSLIDKTSSVLLYNLFSLCCEIYKPGYQDFNLMQINSNILSNFYNQDNISDFIAVFLNLNKEDSIFIHGNQKSWNKDVLSKDLSEAELNEFKKNMYEDTYEGLPLEYKDKIEKFKEKFKETQENENQSLSRKLRVEDNFFLCVSMKNILTNQLSEDDIFENYRLENGITEERELVEQFLNIDKTKEDIKKYNKIFYIIEDDKYIPRALNALSNLKNNLSGVLVVPKTLLESDDSRVEEFREYISRYLTHMIFFEDEYSRKYFNEYDEDDCEMYILVIDGIKKNNEVILANRGDFLSKYHDKNDSMNIYLYSEIKEFVYSNESFNSIEDDEFIYGNFTLLDFEKKNNELIKILNKYN